MHDITIGADPELFFAKGDKFISSIGKIGGSKQEPRRLLGDFALQEDNVSVEYNIPACNSADKFLFANQLMLTEIERIAGGYDCRSVITSSAQFDDDQLEDPAAKVFGCDPDFDAWNLEPNPRPHCDNPNLRSAGGHIHVGAKLDMRQKIALIRTLDLFVGLPLAFMDPESQRRVLYGRAGACRFKPYGVEYRTPSNVWLRSPELIHATYIAVQHAARHFNDYTPIVDAQAANIQSGINELNPQVWNLLKGQLRDCWAPDILKQIKVPRVAAPDAINLIVDL